MSYKVSPSLLCMDLLHAADQLRVMNARADYLHVDMMDTCFVPTMGLFPAFVQAIAGQAALPLDCHLMLRDPAAYVQPLAGLGAACIVPHIEAAGPDPAALLAQIHAAGCRAGLAISPQTPLAAVEPYLDRLERLTVMTITPGFPGAPFLPQTVQKIAEADAVRRARGLKFEIEMDGSLCDDNFGALYRAGCDVFVCGAAALFGRDPSLDRAFDKMRASFDAIAAQEGA